jgi:uncharacterized delta-60 repeat protein
MRTANSELHTPREEPAPRPALRVDKNLRARESRYPVVRLSYALAVCAVALLSMTTLASAGGGDLDPTFSGDGWLFSREFFDGRQEYRPQGAEDIALQADGKILATGELHSGYDMFFGAYRFTAGGDLDRSFGEGGWVDTEVGKAFDHPHAVEVQRDGKIVLGGETTCPNLHTCAALVRYLPDGSLDRGFGRGGIVRTDTGSRALSANRLLVQPGGKLLVLTWTLLGKLVVARYLPDGRLDRTFSRDGFAIAGTNRDVRAEDLALQRDGKIVVLGTIFSGGLRGSDFVVARFQRNGRLDRSFARGGFQTVDFRRRSEWGHGVAIQRDGRIVAVGGSTTSVRPDHARVALVRLNRGGSIDRRFGRMLTRPATGGAAYDVLVQPDGRIVLAGIAYRDPLRRQTSRWLVVRYLANGRLDRSFGRGGFVIGDFGTGDDEATSLLMQPDGKLVVGGEIYMDQGIARYRAG